jgi:hypothetical protein
MMMSDNLKGEILSSSQIIADRLFDHISSGQTCLIPSWRSYRSSIKFILVYNFSFRSLFIFVSKTNPWHAMPARFLA